MTPVALLGPTASGKSQLAMALASVRSDIEIVAVDAMQVYRGMDIGTAKPSRAEQAKVVHHMIDLVEPTEDFSVARFQRAARTTFDDIDQRGVSAIAVGGTGLYVRAVIDHLDVPGQWPDVRAEIEREPDTARLHERLRSLDPVAASRMEPGNRRRVVRALEVTLGSGRPFSSYGPGLDSYPPLEDFVLIGMAVDRTVLTDRIRSRFNTMVDSGLVDECRALLDRWDGALSKTARQALGYREILKHLEHGAALDACVAEAIQRTRTFAVRQERWFRRDPRITWVDATDANIDALADRVLGDWNERCER